MIPGATYGGYSGYGTAMPTYGAASYGTAMPAYGTSMPAYGASYGGGYGGYGGAHPMDVETVKTQQNDALGVLTSQFGVQEKMLDHQHDAQLKMLEAEKARAIAQMTTQYDQQYMQQQSQLTMAKTQREMSIQQQAAQMTAQAKQ